jgi:hypothetical protein
MRERANPAAVNLRLLGASVLMLCACACSSGVHPASQSGSASSTARPAQGAPPPAHPSGSPATSPLQPVRPAPSATSSATPPPPVPISVPRLRPDATPRILSVSVSKTTVGSGDTVSGSVITSSNVASVEARVAAYGVTLVKTGVGRFALTYTFGSLPFFVRGTYQLRIIARNARGDAAQESLPITVR